RAAAGSGTTGGSQRSSQLVRQQRGVWAELQSLVQKAAEAGGLKALPGQDVPRFAALYRETSAGRARARTHRGSGGLLFMLERLVGAGHNLLYRAERHGVRQALKWVSIGFPTLVRRRWRPIAAAAVLFYLPALLSFAAARLDPE